MDKTPCYLIVRNDGNEETIVKVVLRQAASEVKRLNDVNADKNCHYTFRINRIELDKKCITKDCENHTSEGLFVGDLCGPCHEFITKGEGKYSQAYRNAARIPTTVECPYCHYVYKFNWHYDYVLENSDHFCHNCNNIFYKKITITGVEVDVYKGQ